MIWLAFSMDCRKDFCPETLNPAGIEVIINNCGMFVVREQFLSACTNISKRCSVASFGNFLLYHRRRKNPEGGGGFVMMKQQLEGRSLYFFSTTKINRC